MHQSFVTTAPTGPGNSEDFNFARCKVPVNALHCGAIFVVKPQQKAPLKFQQVNVIIISGVESCNQKRAEPVISGVILRLKLGHLSPAASPLSPYKWLVRQKKMAYLIYITRARLEPVHIAESCYCTIVGAVGSYTFLHFLPSSQEHLFFPGVNAVHVTKIMT